MIHGAIGIGYLIGAPIAAFVLFFLLRAGADLIDVWIDSEVAAEKTADLVERQLVPGVLRACQLLERTNEALGSVSQARADTGSSSAAARQQAIDTVRDCIRREAWGEARRLASAFGEQFRGTLEAKDLAGQVEAAFTRRVQALRDQLNEAEQRADAEQLMNTRDRLSGYLDGTELYQVDRRVAHWMAGYLREALSGGRARDVVHLAERVVAAFADSTPEGAQMRASLPTVRRSAGLCPECGQPYDVSLVRCAACESARQRKKPSPAAAR
jgi:hypothetical protein